jgi:DNA-binding MarR family transcriptional regulator
MPDDAAATVALFRELTIATAAAHAQINAQLRPSGQSLARWEVLDRCSSGPTTVPGVARELRLTRQAVQRVVDELSADGLLAPEPNPAHRRSPLFAATAAGRALLEDLRRRAAGWYAHVGRELTTEEIDALRGLLAKLHHAADTFDSGLD